MKGPYATVWKGEGGEPVNGMQSKPIYLPLSSLWVGNSVGNSDVLRNSDAWQRDHPRGLDPHTLPQMSGMGVSGGTEEWRRSRHEEAKGLPLSYENATPRTLQ